jgi:hypothetical protein
MNSLLQQGFPNLALTLLKAVVGCFIFPKTSKNTVQFPSISSADSVNEQWPARPMTAYFFS